ncbi:helix-turn-helix transcriptional regulator [Streptomyces sp. NPDC058664]|uniref:helix-turn-helix transcriptional regulator n=1 Tax=Streptomyces sp. NPDC058664 TaxID=3346585 RepID=UPI00364CAC47
MGGIPGDRQSWTFLTNHARVLVVIARAPDVRLRVVAAVCGVTERTVQAIVADLEAGGYLTHAREGRRNRYPLISGMPFRHPLEGDYEITGLLDLLRAAPDGDGPPARPGGARRRSRAPSRGARRRPRARRRRWTRLRSGAIRFRHLSGLPPGGTRSAASGGSQPKSGMGCSGASAAAMRRASRWAVWPSGVVGPVAVGPAVVETAMAGRSDGR